MHGCTILCWTLEPKVKWRHGVLMSWLITRFMNWYGATDVVPPLKPKSESDMAEILFLGGTVMWKVLCCACKIKNKTIKRVGRLPYEDKHDHNWPTSATRQLFWSVSDGCATRWRTTRRRWRNSRQPSPPSAARWQAAAAPCARSATRRSLPTALATSVTTAASGRARGVAAKSPYETTRYVRVTSTYGPSDQYSVIIRSIDLHL